MHITNEGIYFVSEEDLHQFPDLMASSLPTLRWPFYFSSICSSAQAGWQGPSAYLFY